MIWDHSIQLITTHGPQTVKQIADALMLQGLMEGGRSGVEGRIRPALRARPDLFKMLPSKEWVLVQ